MSGNTIQETNPDLVNLMLAHFQGRYEPQFGLKQAMSLPLQSSQLRGFWPMSSVDENGDVYDLSGQGRTLTNNNAATFNVDGLAPYVEFDGVNQYLSRADEAGLDISGGLTTYGWLWMDISDSTGRPVVSKFGNFGQFAYIVYLNATTNVIIFRVSGTGGALVTLLSSRQTPAAEWVFFACRYTPSTELAVFVGTASYGLEKDTNVVGVPASLFNSTANFMIGWASTTFLTLAYFNGRMHGVGLCADALSDADIFALYQQTRPLFNV